MSSGRLRRPTPRVIALSGPVAAGKSTLALALTDQYGADRLRTQRLLRDIAEQRGTSLPSSRGALQDFGDALDDESGGGWLADAVLAHADGSTAAMIVVDAVRTLDQLEALRDRFVHVDHLHVYAPRHILDSRYQQRDSEFQEFSTYDEVAANATESHIGDLRQG